MDDFYFYRDLIRYFELAAAITGLLTWYKWKGTDFRALTIFLLVIAGCEFFGDYLDRKYHDNAWLYNYFAIPLQIFFFCWLYCRYFSGSSRRLAFGGAIAYGFAFFAEMVFLQNTHLIMMSLSYSVGMLVLIILIICYFLRLFRSGAIVFFSRDMMFWITMGLIVFYLGTFPFYGLYNQLAKDMHLFDVYAWVMIFLNYAMYLSFLTGFIWAKPRPHSSS